RLLWLGNPRSAAGAMPRVVADYNYGVEAVRGLVGAAEDVARLDDVFIVAKDEVASDLVNRHHEASGPLRYTSEACRNLVMWAWSRRPEHVRFDPAATSLTLRAALDLGRKFTPKLGLIQSEDVRFKIA